MFERGPGHVDLKTTEKVSNEKAHLNSSSKVGAKFDAGKYRRYAWGMKMESWLYHVDQDTGPYHLQHLEKKVENLKKYFFIEIVVE